MVEHLAFEPRLDLAGRGTERAAAAGTRGGGGVTGEELECVGPAGERGELDREALYRAGRWCLFEPDVERCRDVCAERGRVLEHRLDQP